ncbi:MAG: hypothetical protein J7M38_05585 [Armatimonadetes bacterium]|nr:hypothetical protein [Armatimonadota bacterium]
MIKKRKPLRVEIYDEAEYTLRREVVFDKKMKGMHVTVDAEPHIDYPALYEFFYIVKVEREKSNGRREVLFREVYRISDVTVILHEDEKFEFYPTVSIQNIKRGRIEVRGKRVVIEEIYPVKALYGTVVPESLWEVKIKIGEVKEWLAYNY